MPAAGLRVAILDVDPQGSLGQWFERRERRLRRRRQAGLVLRTASGWGAKREARLLAREVDLVVIDMPPRSDLESRNAIEAADLVAVPVQPTPVDLWATEATLALIEKGGPPALLVVNRAPVRAIAAPTLAALAALAAPVAESRLGNRVAFGASMGNGSTVMENDPGSKAAAEDRGARRGAEPLPRRRNQGPRSAMIDDPSVPDRVDALEIRAAHNERSLDELNEVVLAQWKEIERLTRLLRRLEDQLAEAEARSGRPAAPGAAAAALLNGDQPWLRCTTRAARRCIRCWSRPRSTASGASAIQRPMPMAISWRGSARRCPA